MRKGNVIDHNMTTVDQSVTTSICRWLNWLTAEQGSARASLRSIGTEPTFYWPGTGITADVTRAWDHDNLKCYADAGSYMYCMVSYCIVSIHIQSQRPLNCTLNTEPSSL